MNIQVKHSVRYKVHLSSVYWISMVLKYLKTIGMMLCMLSLITIDLIVVLNNYVLIIVMKNYNNYLLNLYLNKNKKNTNVKILLGNMYDLLRIFFFRDKFCCFLG